MPLLKKFRSNSDSHSSSPRPGLFSRWSSKDKLKDTPSNSCPPAILELERSYHQLRLKGYEQNVPPRRQHTESRQQDNPDLQTCLDNFTVSPNASTPPRTIPPRHRAATTSAPWNSTSPRTQGIPRFPTTAPRPTHKRPYRTHLLHLLLAEHYFDTLSLPLSIREFSSLPVTPQLLFNLGQLYLFTRSHSAAQYSFLAAVSLDPWFLPAWMQLGYISFVCRRYVEAGERWREALRCFRGGKEARWEQLGLMWTGSVEEVVWNLAAAEGRKRGVRPGCVGFGAIFRVPGRWARGVRVEPGVGTEWGFKGEGKVVGKRESVYVLRR
ncbi:hypothetical protein BDD12DRAFT_898088 [Trichophaea hybrida]|nr:hypothetical protein BDD12DRAFT_898088 [Trichophaea hybrida]